MNPGQESLWSQGKQCRRCGDWWPLEAFPLIGTAVFKQRPARAANCPACADELAARVRALDPPKVERVWTVYRYYDAQGGLLYVGATGQAHWRAKAHNRTALWWPLVARGEMEHFGSEAEAFRRERELIGELDPRFNIADNPGRRTLAPVAELAARPAPSPAAPLVELDPRRFAR